MAFANAVVVPVLDPHLVQQPSCLIRPVLDIGIRKFRFEKPARWNDGGLPWRGAAEIDDGVDFLAVDGERQCLAETEIPKYVTQLRIDAGQVGLNDHVHTVDSVPDIGAVVVGPLPHFEQGDILGFD